MVVNYMDDHRRHGREVGTISSPTLMREGEGLAGWSFAEYQRHVVIKWDVDEGLWRRPRRGIRGLHPG